MKKLVLFTAVVVSLNIFNACKKADELIDHGVNLQTLELNKSDVYSENGYLVIKSITIADSIASKLNNGSDLEQMEWEKSFNIETAKTHRAKLNNRILEARDFGSFDKLVKEAINQGYFNQDSLYMDYPFNNISWASILNKNGIIKIDDVLYQFTSRGGIAVLNGTLEQIEMVKNGKQLPIDVKYFDFQNWLKSVTFSDYGDYFSQRKWEDKYVIDVVLRYDQFKVPKPVIDPNTNQVIWVNMPDEVRYDLYCHQRVKRWYGWFDAQTHLYHKAYGYNIGGNLEPDKNFTYPAVSYSNPNPNIVESSNELSNHYLNIYWTQYPFYLDNENQPAPSVSPLISFISFDIWTGRVGSENDCIRVRIN